MTSPDAILAGADALSFDCYGTLIDWESGISAVLGPWAREQGLDLDDDQLLALYGAHEARQQARTPRALYPEILGAAMTGLGAQLGVEVSPEQAQRLATSVPDWPAFPDSHEALVALARRYRLIILSNIDGASFAASNARLGVSFDEILTAEDVGAYKPSPRNFEALLARAATLGVGEGRLLHVAQSLFHDHVPAKAIGLPTVWINRRRGRAGWGATPAPAMTVQPDREFPSMASFAAACMHS